MSNTLHHSIIHRLPQCYRRCAGTLSVAIAPAALQGQERDNDLIGLRLLSHNGDSAWEIMHKIELALAEIQLECTVLEWEGEPCLFVHRQDEHTTTCRLKNFGVGIAESFVP